MILEGGGEGGKSNFSSNSLDKLPNSRFVISMSLCNQTCTATKQELSLRTLDISKRLSG